jgi:hypothetical protein
MKKPSRLDASFLALEFPTHAGPVARLAIHDVPPGAKESMLALRELR